MPKKKNVKTRKSGKKSLACLHPGAQTLLIKSKSVDEELKIKQFRVAVFGSARIQPEDKIYKDVFKLAKEIAKQGFDIVTGGGEGLMGAASNGHADGDPQDKLDSIGLTIRLPWEVKANKHLDLKKHFNKFSARLDHFMALSNVVVIVPGGIGTCLEFFYTWQLIQVKHICPIPVILMGDMWKKLIDWIKKYPLKNGLISPENLDTVYVVKNNKEAMKIIENAHKLYKQGNYCDNLDLYRLD